MVRCLLVIMPLLLVPPESPADVVTLRSGSTLEGIVRREPGRVRIVMESGTITVAEDLVAGIASRRSPLETYRERESAIAVGEVGARLRLAAWCREQGLPASAREQYERVLVDDPDQAEARQALGYRRHDGVWMTEDQIWIARGYVWSEGAWRTPSEVAERESARRRAEAERLQIALEDARRRLEALEREASRDRERRDGVVAPGDSGSAYVLAVGCRAPRRVPSSCVIQGGLSPWWCVMPARTPVPACPSPETVAWYRPPGPAWNFMPPWGQPR